MIDTLIGRMARVTARVTDQRCGEVFVSVGQGTEAYLAYSADHGVSFPVGAQAVIVDEAPGRTVYISAQ